MAKSRVATALAPPASAVSSSVSNVMYVLATQSARAALRPTSYRVDSARARNALTSATVGGGLCTHKRTRTASTPYNTTDRKSTRLNSSHLVISYAVFCLKKNLAHELKLA